MAGSPFESLESSEQAQPRKRRGDSVLPVVIFAGLAVFVVGSVGCAGIAFLWFRPAQQTSKKARPIYSREEFRAKVIGQTTEGVIMRVGLPDSTHGSGRESENWAYYNCTRDPITGKIDSMAHVFFKYGRVESVSY